MLDYSRLAAFMACLPGVSPNAQRGAISAGGILVASAWQGRQAYPHPGLGDVIVFVVV
jgi:hypothetical protein